MDEAFLALLSAFEALIESGEHIPEEVFQEMTQLILQQMELMQTQAEVSPIVATPKPALPASEHESSNVNGFMYDPKTQKLLVQFHGPYPKADGPIYSYGGVPKFIFDILERGAIGPKTSGRNRYHEWIRGVTPSLGGTLNALIKAGGFPFEKVA